MSENEYAADLKQAIALSPKYVTDAWEYHSYGIGIELVGYSEQMDGPVIIFPGEEVSYEDAMTVGWLFNNDPDRRKTEEQHSQSISDGLLEGAKALAGILSAIDNREAQKLQVPTVLYGINVPRQTAKFAYRNLGFYYLGKNPESNPWPDKFDMAVATDTLKHNLGKLMTKQIRGKTLFERLEKRSTGQ